MYQVIQSRKESIGLVLTISSLEYFWKKKMALYVLFLD